MDEYYLQKIQIASGLEPDNTDNDHEEDELEIKASVSGKL